MKSLSSIFNSNWFFQLQDLEDFSYWSSSIDFSDKDRIKLLDLSVRILVTFVFFNSIIEDFPFLKSQTSIAPSPTALNNQNPLLPNLRAWSSIASDWPSTILWKVEASSPVLKSTKYISPESEPIAIKAPSK
ncbi:hypothetical protein WICPIJ_004259 [Wickerhamomyces pijperi]|uniref:Uncharacterized protein n=1 Tax=Wickerhamomyces pijperi TaxID=599730 RepID=A0A9P8Q832_WICPI|nr:hypothetical protein WICPIJ_004259 [Wickerhamomyces pijperi]